MTFIPARAGQEALSVLHQIIDGQRQGEASPTDKFFVLAPCMVQYHGHQNCHTVLHPTEDNPFLNFFEALWEFGGRNDVAYLAEFDERIVQRSKDGMTVPNAIGFRWRNALALEDGTPVNLMVEAGKTVMAFPDKNTLLPCYHWDDAQASHLPPGILFVQFTGIRGVLDMQAYCNSAGPYALRKPFMTMLHEFVSEVSGIPTGVLTQTFTSLRVPEGEQWPDENSKYPELANYKMINTDVETWLKDLRMFLDVGETAIGYRDRFFRKVALPMLRVHRMWKEGRVDEAVRYTKDIKDEAWAFVVLEFITRANPSV